MSDEEIFTFIIRPAYNSSTSASSSEVAKNSEYFYNGADIAWVMTSTALVFFQIGGITLLHAGLSDTQSAISMFRLPLMTTAVVGCQWFLFGYSITFTEGTTFWGGNTGLVFRDVFTRPAGNASGAQIPEIVYAFFQLMFASFTATLVSGAAYRKVKTAQFLIFIFIWTTIVYDPIARWSWDPQGWSKKNHSLDFAGGTVVHITAGAAVQAFAVFHGLKIWLWGGDEASRASIRNVHLTTAPHNLNFVVLGTLLLWIGWFGFNGGSALGANSRAAVACTSTQIAACFGAVTGAFCYGLVNFLKSQFKISSEERDNMTKYFCDGALAGLVAITPAAGYVPSRFAPLFGVLATISVVSVTTVCQAVAEYLEKFRWEILLMRFDLFEIGIMHAGSGIVGMFLTAFFNRPEIFELDGSSAIGYSQDGRQAGHQLKDAAFGWFWSFGFTLALLAVFSAAKCGLHPKTREDETKLSPRRHGFESTEVQRPKPLPKTAEYEMSTVRAESSAIGTEITGSENGVPTAHV